VLAALAARGVDVNGESARDALVMLDARTTLDMFMDDSAPDPARFQANVGRVIEDASKDGTGAKRVVRAYGEMVDVLWAEGNIEAALRLEELWNELAESFEFSLLCAYAMNRFNDAADGEGLRRICEAHTHVEPTEGYVERDSDAQLVEIALLQQRALALETEIARRQALERELRAAVAKLSAREAELSDVLENAAEGIHLVAADGTINWANDAELRMLGYSADEYIGHKITEFHADRATIDDMLARLAAGETLSSYPARLRRKDGSIRHVVVSSNVLFRDGEFVRTRCFTRDVTALVAANEEREHLLQRERFARAQAERAKAAAEQANRAKSQFLAVMSHELRTPLNAIGGYAELMDMEIHGPITSEQREALDRIQRSQRHLLGLINQVLNYARIESGRLRYDLTNLSLDDVMRNVEAFTLTQIAAKGLQYQCSSSRPPAIVYADQEKVQQILLNLIGNATKFTERGGRISLESEIGDFVVLVRVRDTGIGIAKEKLSTIFDPFVQVDTNYTRTRDGIGLGLAISRDLARGMGGDLTAESTAGKGSTFTLALPRASL
jgi:PAS domain S-box-containing protein